MTTGQLQFTVQPSDIIVEQGMKAVLPCVATGASKIFYVWSNGNISESLALSTNSSDRRYLLDGNLTFNEVLISDEDDYVCMAMDGGNTSRYIVSEAAYLNGMSFYCHPMNMYGSVCGMQCYCMSSSPNSSHCNTI